VGARVVRDAPVPPEAAVPGPGGPRHIPAGATIPPTVHGVSVSIPDLASLIGFESKDPATLRRIPRGYPRFRLHPYAVRVVELMAMGRPSSTEQLVPVRSVRAARRAASYAGLGEDAVIEHRGVSALAADRGSVALQRVRDFVQHTGSHLSSRQAEDVLLAEGMLAQPQAETTRPDGPDEPERAVADAVAGAYGLPDAFGVSIHNSGMNAIYAAIMALDELQRRRRRWLQVGWIFFDTVKLFEKGIVDAEHEIVPNPLDVDQLARVVEERGPGLAGIIAEVPSNPLMQTPDVPALREIAARAGCAVVLDATIGTPHNVDVLDYADVVCESLTKYATGSADVLMGAAVVNPASPLAEPLRRAIPGHGEVPHHRDAARVAARIAGYRERMQRVNANTMALADFFAGQPAVERLHWAYQAGSAENYRRVEIAPDSPGGLLLLSLRVPLERIYDRLAVAKGPSFGAEFTMAAPQVFIAHFDLLSTAAGRKTLRDYGLHRDMLRVSVGTEPPDEISAWFDEVFQAAER
jgi:cystathionine beta-lyase/cystathionine gamma-synthase